MTPSLHEIGLQRANETLRLRLKDGLTLFEIKESHEYRVHSDVDFLVEVLNTAPMETRISAIQSLIKTLETTTKSWLQVKAAKCLGLLEAKEAADTLIKVLLSNPTKEATIEIVNALSKIGNRNHIDSLLKLLSHTNIPLVDNIDVRGAVRNALKMLGASDEQYVQGYIWALSHFQYSDALSEAIESLEKLGDKSAIQPLLELIASGKIGNELENTINKLGGCSNEELVDAYIQSLMLQNDKAVREEHKEEVLARLSELGDKRAIPMIIDVLKRPNRFFLTRASAAKALQRLNAVEAIPALEDALEKESPTELHYTGDSYDNYGEEEIPSRAYEAIESALINLKGII